MTRAIHLLTAAKVKAASKPGLLHDGGGLYLQILAGPEKAGQPAGVTKAWLLRYVAASGKRREMGLGPIERVGLADARSAATAARKLAQAGIDPINQRKADRAAAAQEAAKALTFREAAEGYIKAQAGGWKTAKHAKLWASSLSKYVYPSAGSLPVASVGVVEVLAILEPIWAKKPETASRIRQRIEAILDWAAARGYRARENPARWRGHLQHLLSARAQPVKHHKALPFAKVGAFMADLRKQKSDGAQALELTVLTATRTTETLGAMWEEFDLSAAVWEIPASRMKSKREHRVPLSLQAVALLRRRREAAPKGGKYVFPGLGTQTRPLSGMAMLKTLERMGLKGRGCVKTR